MTRQTGREALIPNPRLKAFEPFLGIWKVTGAHPMIPGVTLHGKTVFEWHEGGAFVVMRTEIDHEQIPSGIAIFGSDDDMGTLSMTYFDERTVSRRYEARLKPVVLEWWRDSPKISQRNSITVGADHRSMRGVGEISENGGSWGPDLRLAYTRIG